MYVGGGGLSMELRALYMLGIYPIINPYPSTFLLKSSVSDSPHLQENGLLGVILYRIPLARKPPPTCQCSYYSTSVNTKACKLCSDYSED